MRGLLERAGRALSIAVVVYLLLWLASILWFWLSMPFSGGGIFGYTLIVNALAGWRLEMGGVRWITPFAGALLYVAALLLTFSLSSTLSVANIAPVDLAALLMGLAPGVVGFAVGRLLRRFRDSRR